MVDARAEDDDEDSFGDFSFVSFPNHNQIKGPKSTAEADDDDWGDFVESPLRSDLSGVRAESKKAHWVKPQGALPLSIFGDEEQAEEEEEQSGAVNPSGGDKHTGNIGNGSRHIAFNDIISTLYNHNQVKAENGFNSISNGPNLNAEVTNVNGSGSNLNAKDLKFNSNELDLSSGLFVGNIDNNGGQIKTISGLSSNSDLFSENKDAQSLKCMEVIGLSSHPDLFAENSERQSLKKEAVGGLSSNFDLFAVNNVIYSPQVKDLSGLNFNSDLFAGNDDNQNPRIRGLNLNSDVFAQINDSPPQIAASDFNLGMDLVMGNNDGRGQQIMEVSGLDSFSSRLSGNPNLFTGNRGFDTFAAPDSQGEQNKAGNLSVSSSDENTSNSNLPGLYSNVDRLILNSNLPGGNEEFDADDDGWEFKDAYSEWKIENGNDNKVDIKQQGNSEVTGISSQIDNGSRESIDFASASNGISVEPIEMDFSYDFTPLTVAQHGLILDKPQMSAQNGLSSDSFFKSKINGSDSGLNSDAVESDEWFGDFQGALTGNGLKQVDDLPPSEVEMLASDGKSQDVTKMDALPSSEIEMHASDGKLQGKETRSTNHDTAFPLAIFGDEELETNDSFGVQDTFSYDPSPHPRNNINSEASNISIHDLISNLYNQSEQLHSSGNTEKLTGNGLDSSDEMPGPSPGSCDDDYDASWEFTDASLHARTLDQTTVCSPTELQLDTHVDFYSKLKDVLSYVCEFHLDILQKAQNTAALSGEDAKVTAIPEDLQELQKENINSKNHSEDISPKEMCLKEFLEVLLEPKFQVLEAEYQLSRRLLLAENNLGSAIEVMKHTTSMLKVLTLGSTEDQNIYFATWSKMISVCARELKHGSLIWKQIVEKNLQSQTLSELQGKSFILTLGEIYRVVVILGASSKLYKPWVLLNSADSTGIYDLIDECYTLWSSSGIEEAIQDLPDLIDFGYHTTPKVLLESIKHMHDLDADAIGNHDSEQQVPVCRLSLLTSEAVPGMKMVFWDGEYYFLTLANLWANLISCNSPMLPRLCVGS